LKKILLIFGTRPEAIKMAPLILELKKNQKFFETEICVTGQHREMLDQVLGLFDITPDFDLDIMLKNQDLYDITANILLKVRDVLETSRPDLVIVHGDTSTTFTAALACFYKGIDFAHLEAGLRTYDLLNPWPEEANRQLCSKLASVHFAPTQKSAKNLTYENIDQKNICVTGNTVVDALYYVMDKLKKSPALIEQIENNLSYEDFVLSKNRKLVLITGHRRENFGKNMLEICDAIAILANKNPKIDFVYPVHLNPNVQKPVIRKLSGVKNIYLLKPLGYINFIYLMSKSHIILTDSGGIQEEAPALGIPVLVMRNSTERLEAIDSGTAKLVGTQKETIINEIQTLLNDKLQYNKMSEAINPYGNGEASKKIVKYLKTKYFK